MNRTVEAQTKTPTRVTNIRVMREGQPAYVLLDYDLYLVVKEQLEAGGPLGPVSEQTEMTLELVADILRAMCIGDEMERDPSKVVTHAELKRKLAEKKAALEAQPEAQHVGA